MSSVINLQNVIITLWTHWFFLERFFLDFFGLILSVLQTDAYMTPNNDRHSLA